MSFCNDNSEGMPKNATTAETHFMLKLGFLQNLGFKPLPSISTERFLFVVMSAFRRVLVLFTVSEI